MSIVYMWEQPVVKFIDLLTEFLRVKIWRILWLEWTELNLDVIGKTMVIIVYGFLFFDIYQGWSCCSSFEIWVCSFVKLAEEVSSCLRILESWLITKSMSVFVCLTGMSYPGI